MSTLTIFRIEYLSANSQHKSNYANGFLDAASAAASNGLYSEEAVEFIVFLAENIQRQNNIDLFDGSFDRDSYAYGWIDGILVASDDKQYSFLEELYNASAYNSLQAWFKLTGLDRPLTSLSNRSLSMGL